MKQKGSPRFAVEAGFAPILIVIIIATLAGGYLIYQKQIKPAPIVQQTLQVSPTPSATAIDETSNWKTYTNGVYSFKYPSDWRVMKSDGWNITISNSNNDIDLTISAVDTSIPATGIGDVGGRGEPSGTKSIIIDGINTVELFDDQELTKTVNKMNISFKKDKISYHVSVNNKGKDFSKIDQILSTFRFD